MISLVFVYRSIGPGWPSRSELGNQVNRWDTYDQKVKLVADHLTVYAYPLLRSLMETGVLLSRGYPDIKLPKIENRIERGLIRGRNLLDGYTRGWGLQFGGLHEEVMQHPLFLEAINATEGRSIVHPHRLSNLFLIICCNFEALDCRNIVEFGSFKGGSAIFMAYLLKKLYPGSTVWAHDTFKGMPTTQKQADLHTEGDFIDADLPGLQRIREAVGLNNLRVVSGKVEDTFPPEGIDYASIGLVHFDMDIYAPTSWAQDKAWPYMAPSAYFVYDDATVSSCLGATQAVEELIMNRRMHSEQIYPHFVFRTFSPKS